MLTFMRASLPTFFFLQETTKLILHLELRHYYNISHPLGSTNLTYSLTALDPLQHLGMLLVSFILSQHTQAPVRFYTLS